jgi:hypothetical protein
MTDWRDWHTDYDDPGSALSRRLAAVQERIRVALDGMPPGPVRVLSLCAGQGRDLIDVLADHPRRHEVTARLVELDPGNAAFARRSAASAGLTGVEVCVGDAASTDRYAGLAPADLVLVCGVYGNISDADVAGTVAACTALTAPGGTVVWTRHRGAPDLVPQICRWYEEQGFTRLWLSDPGQPYGLGVHRYAGPGRPLVPGQRMFTFIR